MFRPILTWLISLRDSVVAEQRADIKAWEERCAAYYDELQKLKQSLSDVRGVRTRLLKLIDAILKGIDFPVEAVSEEWKDSPATAQAAVGSHIDRLRAADLRRAESAESTAEDLRREIRDKERQLETEQRAHEATRHEKKCTEAENRLLAKIHEVDVQRRQAELSGLVQKQVEAEAGAAALKADE